MDINYKNEIARVINGFNQILICFFIHEWWKRWKDEKYVTNEMISVKNGAQDYKRI